MEFLPHPNLPLLKGKGLSVAFSKWTTFLLDSGLDLRRVAGYSPVYLMASAVDSPFGRHAKRFV